MLPLSFSYGFLGMLSKYFDYLLFLFKGVRRIDLDYQMVLICSISSSRLRPS